jgi:peptide/nickel transport system substrate-binding protein
VQIIAAPPLTQLKELNQGDTQVVSLSGARTMIYGFNTLQKPLDDVRVRQAINYAVNRESIVKDVLENNAVLIHGPWANTAWPGYDPDLKPYSYDPAKAKQLLAAAGQAGGFDLVLNFTSGTHLKDRDIAEVIAAQLGEVGVRVKLQQTESVKLNETWKSGAFDGINQVFWSAPSDPGPMITYSFDRGAPQGNDPKLAELVQQSRRAVDPTERAKVLKEMGSYVNDQALWLFIHAQNEFYAKRRNVNWEPIPEYTYGSVLWYQLMPK